MKLKREAHRLFLDTGSGWYWIGDDIEEMNVEMNGSFETKKNIKGQNTVSDSGYSPSIEASPYYANPEDEIYAFLEDIALNRKSGDECKAKYMEVIVKDTEAPSHTAYEEECKIEIVSYGGSTEGFQIAFRIHPAGKRKKGTYTATASTPEDTK